MPVKSQRLLPVSLPLFVNHNLLNNIANNQLYKLSVGIEVVTMWNFIFIKQALGNRFKTFLTDC